MLDLSLENHTSFASHAEGGQFNGLYKIEGKNRKSGQAKTTEEEGKRRKAEEEETGPTRKTGVHLNLFGPRARGTVFVIPV